ncbi:MAG: hypothetical protein ACRD36_11840, partial [Candidatus Acidiferrum sp.]
MKNRFWQAAATTLGVVVILGLWIVTGRRAAKTVQERGDAGLPFAQIVCVPRPPIPLAQFLKEVQFLDNLPDRLPFPDAAEASRLAAAFTAHPWVEKVDRVEILPPAIQIHLTFRVPVLEVPNGNGFRAVDGTGTLLPVLLSHAELPRLTGTVPPPAGSVGSPWGDNDVEAAARTLKALSQVSEP